MLVVKVEALVGDHWKELASGTTIGYKRILRFPTVSATRVRLTVTDAKACLVISNVGLFNAAQVLSAPEITRDKSGDVTIRPADPELVVYYTLDGTPPGTGSGVYRGPVRVEGKVEVRAIAFDPASGKRGPESRKSFDISKMDWKILGTGDAKADDLLDGDAGTAWQQPRQGKMPVDLVIDLGKEVNLAGFRYLPDQGWRPAGIITSYAFYVSEDTVHWIQAYMGEFSNIQNNPGWQVRRFAPVKGRYVRLRALRNTQNDDAAGYAELDVITGTSPL